MPWQFGARGVVRSREDRGRHVHASRRRRSSASGRLRRSPQRDSDRRPTAGTTPSRRSSASATSTAPLGLSPRRAVPADPGPPADRAHELRRQRPRRRRRRHRLQVLAPRHRVPRRRSARRCSASSRATRPSSRRPTSPDGQNHTPALVADEVPDDGVVNGQPIAGRPGPADEQSRLARLRQRRLDRRRGDLPVRRALTLRRGSWRHPADSPRESHPTESGAMGCNRLRADGAKILDP